MVQTIADRVQKAPYGICLRSARPDFETSFRLEHFKMDALAYSRERDDRRTAVKRPRAAGPRRRNERSGRTVVGRRLPTVTTKIACGYYTEGVERSVGPSSLVSSL